MLFCRANIWDALLFAEKSRSRSRHPQTSTCFFFAINKIGGLAFKVLLVEGSVTEPVGFRFSKIALQCGTSSKFQIFFFKDCAPARDNSIFFSFDHLRIFKNRALAREVLRISSIYLRSNRSKLRSRAEHSRIFDDFSSNRAPARDVLEISSVYLHLN